MRIFLPKLTPFSFLSINIFLSLLLSNSLKAYCPMCSSLFSNSLMSENTAIGKTAGKNTNFLTDTSYTIKKVVIDAGHGGKDSGCLGKNSQEKSITLRIALSVGRKIKARYPHIDVVYTRDKDVFIPLDERAAIANRHKADLFISIHCNFITAHSTVNGSETYVLGLHRTRENLEVAKRENAAVFLEDDYKKRYKNYDFDSPEADILVSAMQNSYLERSVLMAGLVEKRLRRDAERNSHGVKQAGFLVLRETTMPSVLIETGYLSNKNEEAFLSSAEGQETESQAIFDAFTDYKNNVENGKTYEISTPTYAARQRAEAKPYAAPAPVASPTPISEFTSKGGKETKKIESGKVESAKVESKRVESGKVDAQKKMTPVVGEKIVAKNDAEVIFKVQLLKSDKKIPTSDAKWQSIRALEIVEEPTQFIYRADGFETYEAAAEACNKLKTSGFKDAFIVAFQGKSKINVQEAIKRSRP